MDATSDHTFDAIVIGSGIGGLTAAAILARMRRARVLVLERHYVAGGFTHEFRRKAGRHWDVGVHYVGDMRPGSSSRAVFDYVSDGALAWQRMPEPFERFVYPDFTFDLHGDPARFERDLVARFPAEAAAIHRYFRDLRRATAWGMRRFAAGLMPAPLGWLLRRLDARGARLSLARTAEYLERHFADPRLKALLVSQWRDHGLPPAESAFLAHAIIATHYFHGGYYPVGGASAIAAAIVPVIEQAGGRVLIRREVTRILVEHGAAVGVEATHKDARETYRAPLVISDAGAHNTYGRLMPETYGAAERAALAALSAPPTAVTLYLSLRESPAALGFRGENYWIAEDYVHDGARETAGTLAGTPPGVYLSFPSLKDPTSRHHTAEILVLPAYAPFREWAGARTQKRGAEYEALKTRMAEGMLALVERHFPGFRALIEYQELSTPLSVEHFTASPRGAIYGLPATPERFRLAWLGVRTPVPGLLLAGSDVYFHGVLGAAMGGVAAAGEAMGSLGFLRAMAGIVRAARRADARRAAAAPRAPRSPGLPARAP